jgi:transglutaminase-like putative cysteine protease
MLIRYGCELSLVVERPTPTLVLVDIHPDRRAAIHGETPLQASDMVALAAGLDAFGNIQKRCLLPRGETTFKLAGVIDDSGLPDARDAEAMALPVMALPAELTTFLNGSRYCETDKLAALAWSTFGHLTPGTAMVEAICDFAHHRLRFDYQSARCTRTALEAYEERVGVCRDFTHLAITLCRCMNIPARYVNGYLGDIGVPPDPVPMDYSAWFEAYLGGSWYSFDARHNCRRIGRLPIARGRDAADVPMVHTFGAHVLNVFKVVAEEVLGEPAVAVAA